MKLMLVRSFFLLAVGLGFSSPAWSQSAEDLRRIIDSKNCPSDLAEYKFATYKEQCGENYMEAMTPSEVVRCQVGVDRLNRTIIEYNRMIRICRGESRSDGWETKLNEAKQRAALAAEAERAVWGILEHQSGFAKNAVAR
jgi:hypothetical protein